jgi:hypothetical protein
MAILFKQTFFDAKSSLLLDPEPDLDEPKKSNAEPDKNRFRIH